MIINLVVDAIVAVAGIVFISKNRDELGKLKQDAERFRDDIKAKAEERYGDKREGESAKAERA